MKYAAVLVVAFVSACAFASDPGQPLDCTDWIIVQPGLTCSVFMPPPIVENDELPTALWARGGNIAVDNEGFLLTVRHLPSSQYPQGRIEIRRTRGGTDELLAYVPDLRVTPLLNLDTIDTRPYCGSGCHGGTPIIQDGFVFDAVNGRLYLSLASSCSNDRGPSCPANYPGGRWIAVFDGFTRMFDLAQTYQSSAPLSFRVPVRPEGMAGADSFSTYWGTLSKPITFADAHPLACDYPSAAPHVGDYLTVADTVPTPAPGQGVYYVTSATYQGQPRFGRKTVNGHLTGRDPSSLPACTQPESTH